MKLCQKCRDAITKAETEARDKYWERVNEDDFSYLDHWEETAAPESECEFWAHHNMRIYKSLWENDDHAEGIENVLDLK